MRNQLLIACLALTPLSACKKSDPAKEPDRQATPAPVGSAGSAGSAAPADAGPTPAERVKVGLAKAAADAAEEQKRWTPELEQQAVAIRDAKHKDAKAALTALLASPHRMPKHPARDAARHPVETLTFFGVTPTSTVVEVGAGGGWYTELLAPLLSNRGKLIVAGPDANGPETETTRVYGTRLDRFLAKSALLFGKVERVTIKPDAIKLAPDGSADVVLAIREMHNWQGRGELDKYLSAAHAALEDGGTFGVVAHRAAPDAKVEDLKDKGYLPEAWVIEQVKAAGFELVEKSEINANPKDTKDHPGGVWSLPPNLRETGSDKAKFEAIGESDRMTLRFRKVSRK